MQDVLGGGVESKELIVEQINDQTRSQLGKTMKDLACDQVVVVFGFCFLYQFDGVKKQYFFGDEISQVTQGPHGEHPKAKINGIEGPLRQIGRASCREREGISCVDL